MNIADFLQWSSAHLEVLGVESGRLESELLLEHVLKKARLELVLDRARVLTGVEREELMGLVERRGRREPLQHLLGTACFCGLEIRVTKDVLIPRPETELLAELAWKYLGTMSVADHSLLSFLDFGVGSGCLSLAVLAQCPGVSAWALDISPAAIEIARENAERNDFSDRIRFVRGGGFGELPEGIRFHLILSNPPYIPRGDIDDLEPEVRDHDPRAALDGGPDGLEFYRMFAEEAGPFLQPGGRMMTEFGDGQSQSIREIFVRCGWNIEAIEKDLNGIPRFMIALPPKS